MDASSPIVHFFCNQQQVHSTRLLGPVEIGRQRQGEPEPVCEVDVDSKKSARRVIIAPLKDVSVPRRHLRLEPLSDGRLQIENVSASVPVALSGGRRLEPSDTADLELPTLITVGNWALRIESTGEGPLSLQSLGHQTLPPGQTEPKSAGTSLRALDTGVDPQVLVAWLNAVMPVLQSAAGSSVFLMDAAKAVLEIVGLDTSAVALRDNDQWLVKAVQCTGGRDAAQWEPSSLVLSRVLADRTTIWGNPDDQRLDSDSIRQVDAVVAAPVLNVAGQVIGAVYGDRLQSAEKRSRPRISEVEAALVEVIAQAVAAGLARLEHERTAMKLKVQFEQYFTPEVAQELLADSEAVMSGKDAEVSLLFCDIRGFSAVSRELGPSRTVAWINDVMGELSECVSGQQGVLVDYIGDELMAMWGAPIEQPNHATLACRAALEMLDLVPRISRRWEQEVGRPLELGIGINSGHAYVGNTGTHRKLKYGPLGNAVNIASRVQGATKFARTPLLVTGNTVALLDGEFERRRIARVRVLGIREAVELYELAKDPEPAWIDYRNRYEQALEAFEQQKFLQATTLLGNLQAERRNDGPTLQLLSRSVKALAEPPLEFDPVWSLTSK